jgi:phosphotransferase system HPr (HPr) family protein
MKKKEMTLKNEHGLHLRVAGEIVKLVKSHECKLSLSCDGCKHVNACSIIQLLTLGATKGTRVEAHAEGPDEEVVMAELSNILGDGEGI